MTKIQYPNEGVKLTMDFYAKDIRRALGTYRRRVTEYRKECAKAGRINSARLMAESAEGDVYGAARNAAHYAFHHGLIERLK